MARSNLSDSTICLKCLRLSEQLAEKVPMGALRCSKCGHYNGVSVRYKKATVTWAFGGFDKEQEVLYTPIKITGSWSRADSPLRVTCLSETCGASMPLWQLSTNKCTKPPTT